MKYADLIARLRAKSLYADHPMLPLSMIEDKLLAREAMEAILALTHSNTELAALLETTKARARELEYLYNP